MKMCSPLKPVVKKLFILGVLCCTILSTATAQQLNSVVQSYLQQNQKAYNLTERDVVSWMVTNQYQDDKSGVQHVYIQQHYKKNSGF
jgi:hypothetical protein